MLKTWITAVAALTFAFSAVACGGDDPPEQARGGREACEMFEQVSTGYAGGQITAADYPTQMREVATAALGENELVYDTARLASTLMTEQGKAPEDPDVQQAVGEISTECDAVLADESS